MGKKKISEKSMQEVQRELPPPTSDSEMDIGLDIGQREDIAKGLSHLLADEYTLYLKTHNFHWNVTGPLFNTLHLMFEKQYQEAALAVDEIAERIRALGFNAPGTYGQFVQLASIKEEDTIPPAMDMVRLLMQGHESCVRTARKMFSTADDAHDEPTCDMLTQRMQVHEKTAWMLRSTLKEIAN